MQIINISSYKFVKQDNVPFMQRQLLDFCHQQSLKGTIILAPEGINLNLAGLRCDIDAFIKFIQSFANFSDMDFKESMSETQPFRRMLVKIKQELVPTGQADLITDEYDDRVTPLELKQWLDTQKEFTLLDTRNEFEYQMGTFDKAIHLNLETFREFSNALKQLDDSLKNKPVVIFCTGGIRCEKAAPLMAQAGFEQVYQLEGGILKYFEQCGHAHYQGECFVFDERGALNSKLEPVGQKRS